MDSSGRHHREETKETVDTKLTPPQHLLEEEETEAPGLEENVNSQMEEGSDGRVPDDIDPTRGLGWGRRVEETQRGSAVMSTERDAEEYYMTHKRRGHAIILAHDYFDTNLEPRKCARSDTNLIKFSLKHLGFQVEEHWNLDKKNFYKVLKEVSGRDHQNNDCLVVVFMSHGKVDEGNKEFLCTRDGDVDTTDLWRNFTADRCPSLAGKPKLFFIQACRGTETDQGIQMKRYDRGLPVMTDSGDHMKRDDNYIIPLRADMLIMWASYPGMFAFKSQNNGINGSVFIHFLAKVFKEEGRKDDLSTLLLRVTREVATLYESYNPNVKDLHGTKQIPYTVSTLMRKVYFPV